MFFFFFFNELYYKDGIRQAFKNICLTKMLSDGYFDMSMYIEGKMNKDDIRGRLSIAKSPYIVLYDDDYPTSENSVAVWEEIIEKSLAPEEMHIDKLTYDESSAIVNWVYQVLSDTKEREEFTRDLFGHLEELQGIAQDICFSQGVAYDKEKVDVRFLSSITELNDFIAQKRCGKIELFYRGHANANYILLPSIMRSEQLMHNESKMYNELMINCPNDFEKCRTHLEKLVEMQHYGLPTRLLDITRNPLVALYFACEDQFEAYGELVLISAEEHEIKYPQSDTISILASLPVFSYDIQTKLCEWAEDSTINDEEFNQNAKRLIHEVRLEKPAFEADVKREDVLKNYIICALKSNSRIVKQDGAFIICGLRNSVYSLDEFRYREDGKKVVVFIKEKQRILEQLEAFSINRAMLFPEIDSVSEYIKSKYS